MRVVPLFFMALALVGMGMPVRAASLPWQVQGVVLEKGTRRPLPLINVFLVEDDTHSTVTDAQGKFVLVIDKPGDYSLSAMSVDYERLAPQKFRVGDDQAAADVTLYLEPATTLPGVVVYADRNPDKVSKISITGKELHEVAGSAGDPLRGLQTLPGITVSGDTSAAPAIRGTSPDDNLYYVDGLPVFYLFHFGGMFSVFNADLVTDFNFFPSAFGPEYDNALGGVIDVRLREPRTDRFGAKLNINFYESDFLIEGPVNDRQSYYFSARRSYYDLILPKSGDFGDDENGVEYRQFPAFYDYQGKYVWRVNDDNTVNVLLTGAGDKFELFVPEDSKPAAKDPVLTGSLTSDTSFDSQGVVWSGRLSSQSNHKFRFSHMTSDVGQSVGSAGTVFVAFDSYQVREELTTKLNDAHTLLLGGGFWSTDVNLNLDARNPRCTEFDPDCDLTSAERLQSDDQLSIHGATAYAKDRWRLTEPFTLILGARFSTEDYLDGPFIEPRLGGEWQVTPRTRLTAGWGKYHQFPDGEQVIDTFGNPDLSSLRGRHSVLGALHKFDDGWSWSTELYYKTMEDLVVADDTFRYLNNGSGEAYGVDILIKKELTDRFSGWISTTLSRSERTNETTGETFPANFDQPVVINLVSNYKLTNRWTLGASWRYHSGNPDTPITGGTLRPGSTDEYRANYGETNSDRLPAYHRLDLRLGRDFVYNTWKLNTYFELINAYNHKNVDGYSYSRDYSSRKPVYQLPLLFSFGVQAEF
ncbi:MAG: TonB-dependent receptor [Gammaproteobacteria bacterium]|nr:TonB-dependent receptor [Gammaproteobacteria bacterium]